MLEKSIKPQLDGQLEARPIAMLVQVASQYDSTVYLETEGRRINAKSIMGMMSLAASLGTEIRIIIHRLHGEEHGLRMVELL